jgi:predicted CoA-binding protein
MKDEKIKDTLWSCKTVAVVGISPKEDRPSNIGYWDLFVIWPACAKPRHAGRRQVLGIWCLISLQNN